MLKILTIAGSLFLSAASLAQECVSVDTDKAELTFTGYKFTDKTGVSGTFKEINWFAPGEQSLEDVLAGSALAIQTSSIDAGAEARDANIKESLFKTLLRGHTIRAVARSLSPQAKKLNVDLFMGGGVRPVSLNYTTQKGEIVLKGEIDLMKLGYTEAFKALADQCRDLHKGEDGKAKTWSDVAIEVRVPYTEC